MSHVDSVPSKRGSFVYTGFNDRGVPLIHLFSKNVTKLIREDCIFKDSGLSDPFETTEAGLKSKYNAILDLLK